LRDHVITRFASAHILQFFSFFFSVPLSFWVFASFIFLCFVSASSNKKKVIFHLVTVSNHISNIYKKRKKKQRY
jgi:hypothetical protein